MNNYRPLLTFVVTIIAIAGIFGAALAVASHYDKRSAKKAVSSASQTENTQKPKESTPSTSSSQKETDKKSQTETKSPSTSTPSVQSQPQSKASPSAASSTPPSSPTPQPQAKASEPLTHTSSQVPKTGATTDFLLTAVSISVVTFLVVRIRRQSLQLKGL